MQTSIERRERRELHWRGENVAFEISKTLQCRSIERRGRRELHWREEDVEFLKRDGRLVGDGRMW